MKERPYKGDPAWDGAVISINGGEPERLRYMLRCAGCGAAIASGYEVPWKGRWWHAGCLKEVVRK